jgi:hypothetical protein
MLVLLSELQHSLGSGRSAGKSEEPTLSGNPEYFGWGTNFVAGGF